MDLDGLFKELVWDSLVRAALRKLFSVIPLLGWGPIGWVVSALAFRFAGKLYDEIATAIALEAIELRNEGQRKAFDLASIELKLIAMQKGADSEEFKTAREKHTETLADLMFIDV